MPVSARNREDDALVRKLFRARMQWEQGHSDDRAHRFSCAKLNAAELELLNLIARLSSAIEESRRA